VVPEVAADGSHVYHLYTIRHPRHDELVRPLNAHGAQTAVNYPTAVPFRLSLFQASPRAIPERVRRPGPDRVAADICGDHARAAE
jgi:hypothetical protein